MKHIIKTQKHITLDMTDYKGLELRAEILQRVKDTQQYIIQPLPNNMLITQAQFEELKPDTIQMYETVDRVYITPLNAMEMEIV